MKSSESSGIIERIEDKTPFYTLPYKQRRIFSTRIKNYSLEELVIKMVLDVPSNKLLFSNKVQVFRI